MTERESEKGRRERERTIKRRREKKKSREKVNGDFVLSVLSQGGRRKKRSLGDGVKRNYDEFKEHRTKKGDTNLTEGKSRVKIALPE